jgi:hypothetical protein
MAEYLTVPCQRCQRPAEVARAVVANAKAPGGVGRGPGRNGGHTSWVTHPCHRHEGPVRLSSTERRTP